MFFQFDRSLDIPVLFLIFNRPDTTEEVFQAIRLAQPKKLYVAADGPRTFKEGEKQLCQKTREIINQVNWDCDVKTLYRDSNLGCKEAVSGAINWFFENEELGIILEDDCLPDLSFFYFCKDLLLKYKDNEQIMLIGGHNFVRDQIKLKSSYYFSHYPHIWGWATWKRAWEKYDKNILNLDLFINEKLPNIYISYKQRKYLINNLKLTKFNDINTWDYQWGYSILNNKGLAITPVKNMVINLGFRNQSTHSFLRDKKREISKLEQMDFPLIHPDSFDVNLNLDFITYNNVMSKSPSRLLRLMLENGFLEILKYFWKSRVTVK